MQTRKAADNITDLGPTVKIGRISLRLFVSVLLNRQSLRIMGWADARNSKEKKCRYICLSLNCKYRKIVIKIFNICSRRICIFISPDNPHILIDISSLGILFLFNTQHIFAHTSKSDKHYMCLQLPGKYGFTSWEGLFFFYWNHSEPNSALFGTKYAHSSK